ncbi:MAG: glutamate racemase [Nitratiruptor sp.]|nr:glutamate racemase [Nitratiruptor sp.]NPA83785.1 glutamate racemase [Campylobacterota bacterium]
MRAAVFDSGVGGLTVVKSLIEHRFFDEIIYFGDTARVPYGTKDKNTIVRYSLEALEFFKNFDPDLLIAACNSVSAHALEELRESATFPVVGVIEPGVLAAKERLEGHEPILVIGTKATISSGQYEELLRQEGFCNLTFQATPLFVPLVEEGILTGPIVQATMDHYFHNLPHPKGIILGCTHFPLLQEALTSYFGPETILIHSGEAICDYLHQALAIEPTNRQPELKLFASESPEKLKRVAREWLRYSSR